MPDKPPRYRVTRPHEVKPSTENLIKKIRSSRRMQALARAVLKRDPLCCDPLRKHTDIYVQSQEAHHIVGLAEDATRAFDMQNMVGLCILCHDEVERLVVRRIKTAHLFAGQEIKVIPRSDDPSISSKTCKPTNGGIYCARMKAFRSTQCAGCNI